MSQDSPKLSGIKEQMCEYVVSATAADGSWYISLILEGQHHSQSVEQFSNHTHAHTVCVLNVVDT